MLIYSDIAIALCVTATTTALFNGEQTHYDYLVLTTRGLNTDKTKVYFKVEGYMYYSIRTHTGPNLRNSLTVLPGFHLHEVCPPTTRH